MLPFLFTVNIIYIVIFKAVCFFYYSKFVITIRVRELLSKKMNDHTQNMEGNQRTLKSAINVMV